ncbi:DUF979 domain-containing protein [Thermoanaerobacterium thermosaccharolyticum]|uniref:DUF979 domain-containing protein n=1 Tax=Thermoanaerobacterium thermosaccharolyticum TaxID=1517 RepID=UPI003DA82EDC
MANNLLEIMYIMSGIVALYIAVKTFAEKDHVSRIPTSIFWGALGIVMAFGKWLPPMVSGILIIVMAIPAMIKKVKPGNNKSTPEEYRIKMSNKLGYSIFIPAFTIGVTALIFAFTPLGALVGLGIGAILSAIIILIMSKDSPAYFFTEGRKLLDAVGPLSMLPQLLASLGAIFTAAGVGTVISNGIAKIIPSGNIFLGVAIYAIGMALFTIIMGNAFAAFSVITVGIGIPFAIKLGLDPNIVGMVALTSGYCGTLMTPMAANFNIVPVAVLEMKDKYGVIKKQVLIAIVMLIVQILFMYFFGKM